MQRLPTLQDQDIAGKRLLIREDFNVPLRDGVIVSDARIRAALPTVQSALTANARVLLLSHLGRPAEGRIDPALSLAPVAERLSELLRRPVPLLANLAEAETASAPVALLENTRFLPGESANDPALSRRLANLGDLFVMDAFAVSHRAQASTVGIIQHACAACAGPLLAAELDALGRALAAPARPLLAVVGGAKVSSKLAVLERLAEVADQIIVGGGIANTFAAARGLPIGASLHEPGLVATAQRIAARTTIPEPVDWMTARQAAANAPAILRLPDQVAEDEMILDVGPETARRYQALVRSAGTLLWNGPLGVFEFDQFGEGTRLLAESIAAADAWSVAGGGDTLAAIEKYGVQAGISCLSTGGGAFLEFVEGKSLPAVAALQARMAV